MKKQAIKILPFIAVTLLAVGGFVMLAATMFGQTDEDNTESTEEASIENVKEYSWEDYCSLDKYTDYVIDIGTFKVSKADIDEAEKQLLEDYATFEVDDTDNVADEDDYVNVSYKTIKGEKYSVEKTTYRLTDTELPASIVNALRGVKIGETVKSEVTEDGTQYRVTLHQIERKVIPKATDEFFAKNTGEKTRKAWRKSVKTEKEKLKAEERENAFKEGLANTLIGEAEWQEFSEDMLKDDIAAFKAEDKKMADEQGMSFEDFIMGYYGYTQEEYDEKLKEYTINSMRVAFLLDAIASKENITVSDEDFEAFIEECIASEGYDSREAVLEQFGENIVKTACRNSKVWKFLMEQNTLRENQ